MNVNLRFNVIPMRFERMTHALEGRCSIQLSYGTILNWFRNEERVIPMRFERMTHALEGRCSIQLSYGTILNCGCKGTYLFLIYK